MAYILVLYTRQWLNWQRKQYMESWEAQISQTRSWSVFTGAEDLFNLWHLTYQSSDIKYNVPLTPNHFLIGRPGGDFAGKAVDDICYDLQKCWKCTKELVKHVSRRWMQESLPRLNACHKCFKARRDFKVGVGVTSWYRSCYDVINRFSAWKVATWTNSWDVPWQRRTRKSDKCISKWKWTY